GALVLGAGLYIFLNNHFEKVQIIVAKNFLDKNKTIELDDLASIECLKSSLPDGYVTSASEAAGKILQTERQPMDPITYTVFKEIPEGRFTSDLKESEVLIALSIDYAEPVVSELGAGTCISIISTEKEESLQYQNTQTGSFSNIIDKGISEKIFQEGSIIEKNIFSLSENIMVIDGQVIIKNLEVLGVSKTDDDKNRPLAGGGGSSTFIYMKCDIKEAPAIARITKDKNYKIVVEKS
ncbi:MAG: SAF domain-containing protein, partial [Actinobacteria bacterium]|nr:SAF domain-containing protein [Actinomycetota bacterium]